MTWQTAEFCLARQWGHAPAGLFAQPAAFAPCVRSLATLGFGLLLLLIGAQAHADITLENSSQAPVKCRVSPVGLLSPRDMTIAAGTTETLSTEKPIDCQFLSGAKATRYKLEPGRSYRFQLAAAGQLELRTLPAQVKKTPDWPQVRELNVVIAGGKEYRSFYRNNWHDRTRGIVEAAAERFEQQFPIRLHVVGFRDWMYDKAPQTADDAFEWLHKVDRGDADLVIGFTMVPFPGSRGEIRGVSQYFSRCVVIPDCWGTTGATTRLVHELCHVFGAFHVADPQSVMQLGFERTPTTFRFGPSTEQVIDLAKGFDFERGVESLSPEVQAKIREIYRQYHHPLENAEDDPIVVGYRYQARRAGWSGDTTRRDAMQAIADRLAPPKADAPSPTGTQIVRPGDSPRRHGGTEKKTMSDE